MVRPQPLAQGAGVAAHVAARMHGIVGKVAPADLDAHLLERIARFKRPKRYEFVDELPKNSYGKVLKTALRAGLVNILVTDEATATFALEHADDR